MSQVSTCEPACLFFSFCSCLSGTAGCHRPIACSGSVRAACEFSSCFLCLRVLSLLFLVCSWSGSLVMGRLGAVTLPVWKPRAARCVPEWQCKPGRQVARIAPRTVQPWISKAALLSVSASVEGREKLVACRSPFISRRRTSQYPHVQPTIWGRPP